MQTELVDINELSDSREVMSQRTPRSIVWFLIIITVIVFTALIFACFGSIETYIKANGEIKPIEPISTITSVSSGKISNISVLDGAEIKEGDTILELDCEYYNQQKVILESQLTEKQDNIENYTKLISAIEKSTNCFDEQAEPIFYYQYKNYETEAANTIMQIIESNNQSQNSINEIEQAIYNAESSLSITISSYNEYVEFYNLIKCDEPYSGTNQTLTDIYNNYKISLDKASAIYNGYVIQYDELHKQNQISPELVTSTQVEQALYTKEAAYADICSVKANLLLQLNDIVDNLSQQIKSSEETIENYKLKKESLAIDTNTSIIVEQIKESYYLSINNTIHSLNQEISTLEGQLLNITETISKSALVAEQDGFLFFSKDYVEGDILSAGDAVCTIIPKDKKYKIVMYIPDYNILDVSVGQKVDYNIKSISSANFKKIHGTITEISEVPFIDQNTGQKYYKAICDFPYKAITDKNGETKEPKSGLGLEINVITEEKKIIIWLLEKLNFI